MSSEGKVRCAISVFGNHCVLSLIIFALIFIKKCLEFVLTMLAVRLEGWWCTTQTLISTSKRWIVLLTSMMTRAQFNNNTHNSTIRDIPISHRPPVWCILASLNMLTHYTIRYWTLYHRIFSQPGGHSTWEWRQLPLKGREDKLEGKSAADYDAAQSLKMFSFKSTQQNSCKNVLQIIVNCWL